MHRPSAQKKGGFKRREALGQAFARKEQFEPEENRQGEECTRDKLSGGDSMGSDGLEDSPSEGGARTGRLKKLQPIRRIE